MAYGPFHRPANRRTQALATAKAQLRSGEIWGRAPRGGDAPQVLAFDGPLPPGRPGVEFTTPAPPDRQKMSGEVVWCAPEGTPHVEMGGDGDTLVVRARIVKARYACGHGAGG